MKFETNKDKGRAGLALAIAYFGANGYTISTPLNDTQWYDLIVEKDGVFQTVQCKATGSADGRIDFRCTGGTKGDTYDYTLKHPLDLIFCIDQNLNLFCIPVKDIPKNQKGIKLRTTPNSNNQGFNTYKYLVQI